MALPAVLLATAGTVAAYFATDHAVREQSRDDAWGLAGFVATSFGAVESMPPGTPPRVAHRAVTNAVRAQWSALKLVDELRIVGRDGRVKWSRAIEEEDREWPQAARLLEVATARGAFDDGEGEVIYPLGGMACGGCHTGDTTLKAGVLQLKVSEPALRARVAGIFRNAAWFIALFVLVLTAAVFAAMRVLVTRRLARLSALMKRAEDGDMVVRAPTRGGDEISRLGTAFNRMLERLTDFKVNEIETQRELDLKAQVEQRATELQLLYDLSRTIAATLDLDEVLSLVIRELPKRLDVQQLSVMLVNAESRLEVRKAFPPGDTTAGLTFAVGEGVAGHAAQTRAPYYVADLANEPRFARPDGRSGSLLSVPMVRSGELLGVLNFERNAADAFPEGSREFFLAVAGQVGLAVQNARLHEQTVELSVTDPLTGVPNRRFFYQQLAAELARAQRYGTPLSMVMVDIDHFKQLNDRQGHSAGDDVLREVAKLMKQNLRKADTLARYGGEEFIVLLPQVGPDEAREAAEKLRRAVAEAALPQGKTQPLGHVSISAGVACMPRDAQDELKLIDAADSALYASKRGGRNTVTAYEPGMEAEPTRQRSRLARAITGELPIAAIAQNPAAAE